MPRRVLATLMTLMVVCLTRGAADHDPGSAHLRAPGVTDNDGISASTRTHRALPHAGGALATAFSPATVDELRCASVADRTLRLAAVAPGAAPPGARTASPSDDSPDPADVVTAYQRLERWVRSFDPPPLDDPDARAPIRQATALCAIIRLRGRVLGIGIDTTGDDLMLRRAAGRALSEVLGDDLVHRLGEGAREQLGLSLTVELEVAGEFVPLPGRTYADFDEQLNPGLDGVALRQGDEVEMMFPSQMRATGTAGAAGRLLQTLAVEMGLPPMELSELTRRFKARPYRFRTIHLTQRAPGRFARETFRGQQIVEEDAIDEQALLEIGDDLLDHLITSLWTDEQRDGLGLMGDYRPVADSYEPAVAPSRDQALTAFALARFSNLPQLTSSQADRARATAIVVLQDLAVVLETEIDPRVDPAACAAIVYARSEFPQDWARLEQEQEPEQELPPPRAAAAARNGAEEEDAQDAEALQRLIDDAAGLVMSVRREGDRLRVQRRWQAEGDAHAAADLPPHTQAMLAGAFCRLLVSADRGDERPQAGQARAILDAGWEAVPETDLVTLMPWLAWGESDIAAATGAPLGNAERLATIADVLRVVQIDADSGGDPDLHGGFALSGRGRSGLADAQSARPMAFLGWSLRQPAVISPEQRVERLARQLLAMRFLRQLTVEDSMLWAIRVPQRALGGIRAAPWESDQPLAAQAMGLLAITETLQSLHFLSEREADP